MKQYRHQRTRDSVSSVQKRIPIDVPQSFRGPVASHWSAPLVARNTTRNKAATRTLPVLFGAILYCCPSGASAALLLSALSPRLPRLNHLQSQLHRMRGCAALLSQDNIGLLGQISMTQLSMTVWLGRHNDISSLTHRCSLVGFALQQERLFCACGAPCSACIFARLRL